MTLLRAILSELFEDVGDVQGEDGLGDVVGVGDVFAGVAELGGGALSVGLLVDEPARRAARMSSLRTWVTDQSRDVGDTSG
ncbi:hypothetical protein GCM10022251_35860 [Phytohabitans flavus]|uniref:Uncharacterized protein n=1 Tax=Phytohabitans flavus TaxID=1076124 RepID=A0A6F8XML5_9ACTN|nr:hypothetical protein Pflav_014570 [Phytohabitans flavus]